MNRQGMYLATITVQVPLCVDVRNIGGEPTTLDECAAWEAANVAQIVVGAHVREILDSGGYDAYLGLRADVSRLERLQVEATVEASWDRVAERRRTEADRG